MKEKQKRGNSLPWSVARLHHFNLVAVRKNLQDEFVHQSPSKMASNVPLEPKWSAVGHIYGLTLADGHQTAPKRLLGTKMADFPCMTS